MNMSPKLRYLLDRATQDMAKGPELYPSILLRHLLITDCLARDILHKLGVSVVSDIQADPPKDFVKVLMDSIQKIAEDSGDLAIGTEHLLLWLAKIPVVVDFLANAGVSYADIKVKTLQASNLPEEKNADYPTLRQYGNELTGAAKENLLDPIIGRDKEIGRMEQILGRRIKNNPVLVGAPGVGKTAVVEGLAQRIVSGECNEYLRNKQIWVITLNAMVADAMYRGMFEGRMRNLLKEIEADPNVIVFIDEVHTMIGAGSHSGQLDAANIMKPYLARGAIRCIGATTEDEYRRYIEKDPALERRFQMIKVEEPTVDEALDVLKGVKHRYEKYHNVAITEEAMEAAVRLSDRYMPEKHLPDKCIDIMDEAASRAKMGAMVSTSEDRAKTEEEIKTLSDRKMIAIQSSKMWQIPGLNNKIQEHRIALTKLEAPQVPKHRPEVSKDDISHVVSNTTGIPVERLSESELDSLRKMEENLHKDIVGQDTAIGELSKAIRRNRVGIRDLKRPIGSFVFTGPSGVGKTAVARALAKYMFHDPDAMFRVDMSEFTEKHSVSRLIGSPPGYVGFEQGGMLTNHARRRPYSVILFDEIEKAHPEVLNILLQVMDAGRLTDAHGHNVNFKNTILIMTTNVGSRDAAKKQIKVGFGGDNTEDKTEIQEKAVKNFLPPEFLNRLTGVIVFHQLTDKHLKDIIPIMVRDINSSFAERKIELTMDKRAIDWLLTLERDKNLGARPIRELLRKHLEDTLTDAIIDGEVNNGNKIKVSEEEGKLTFKDKN